MRDIKFLFLFTVLNQHLYKSSIRTEMFINFQFKLYFIPKMRGRVTIVKWYGPWYLVFEIVGSDHEVTCPLHNHGGLLLGSQTNKQFIRKPTTNQICLYWHVVNPGRHVDWQARFVVCTFYSKLLYVWNPYTNRWQKWGLVTRCSE